MRRHVGVGCRVRRSRTGGRCGSGCRRWQRRRRLFVRRRRHVHVRLQRRSCEGHGEAWVEGTANVREVRFHEPDDVDGAMKNCTNDVLCHWSAPKTSTNFNLAAPAVSKYHVNLGWPGCHRQRKLVSTPATASRIETPRPTRPPTQPTRCNPQEATCSSAATISECWRLHGCPLRDASLCC